jgi:hypothetical protein
MSTTSGTSANRSKTVGDPNSRYESLKPLWKLARGILNGQAHAKALDRVVDSMGFSNILLPFSPSMTQEQYNFYKAEAELPGLTAQYVKVLIGGMLRKSPEMVLPQDAPEGALDWLKNEFTSNNDSLVAFLSDALTEELYTSRAWVMVDHPVVVNYEALEKEERDKIRPYPILLEAESVINWKVGPHPVTGKHCLLFFVVRGFEENFEENEYHPDYIETVHVHELDAEGFYRVKKYQIEKKPAEVGFINGQRQNDFHRGGGSGWELISVSGNILANGKRMTYIPALPLNGNIHGDEPLLMPLIDREVSLYNKVSRRNHLLLGSATYTPVIVSDMTDDQFEEVVEGGLGSWIKVNQGDDVKALETPSRALRDMEQIIQNTVNEMARLGIRMMAAENGGGRESGVALEIRNAGQSAMLSSISFKVSSQMKRVIIWMLNWKYDTNYKVEDITFNLTPDLNPAPLGADWLRLVTEWYQGGLIPRSTFLEIAKANDIIDANYDDIAGQDEINQDDLIMGGLDAMAMENVVKAEVNKPTPIVEDDEEQEDE